MTTGQRIKAARKKAEMTQKALAEKISVTASMVGQWENDLRNPKIETLIRIANALDVDVSYLLGVVDEHGYLTSEFFADQDDFEFIKLLGMDAPPKRLAAQSNYLMTEKASIQDTPERALTVNVNIDPEWKVLDDKVKNGTATPEEEKEFIEMYRKSFKKSAEFISESKKRLEYAITQMTEEGKKKVADYAEDILPSNRLQEQPESSGPQKEPEGD